MTNLNVQVITRIILMGLLMFLSSCAAKKLVISNADSLLEHQVVKRIPLYSDQKKALAKDIQAFLNEKKKEAPELLTVIDEVGLDEETKVEAQYRKIAKIYDQISVDFTTLLSRHMAKLDSKQQKDFFETLDDENRDMARKDPDERLKKAWERFKTFFGTVTEKQKQLLVELKDDFEANNKAKLQRRKVLHARFKELYASQLSPNGIATGIAEAFRDYQKEAHDHDKNVALLKKFLPLITPEQKEFFRKQVAEVKEMLKLYLETDY